MSTGWSGRHALHPAAAPDQRAQAHVAEARGPEARSGGGRGGTRRAPAPPTPAPASRRAGPSSTATSAAPARTTAAVTYTNRVGIRMTARSTADMAISPVTRDNTGTRTTDHPTARTATPHPRPHATSMATDERATRSPHRRHRPPAATPTMAGRSPGASVGPAAPAARRWAPDLGRGRDAPQEQRKAHPPPGPAHDRVGHERADEEPADSRGRERSQRKGRHDTTGSARVAWRGRPGEPMVGVSGRWRGS